MNGDLKLKGCRPLVVSFVCCGYFGDPVQVVWVNPPQPPLCSTFPHTSPRLVLFPSQPIVDLSPIKRSASSLTQQHHQEAGLREYNLERPNLAQSSTGPGQVQGQDRAHHHHHHHRCHRRRDKDKDKKQKSLDRATSVQPSSTVGEKKNKCLLFFYFIFH